MTHVLPYRRRKITYQSKGEKQEKAHQFFKGLILLFLVTTPIVLSGMWNTAIYNIKLKFNIMSESAIAME